MAISLMDTVMDQLKGPVLEQIGGWIGETPEKTKAAADGIVPSLLSKLIDLVAKPDGEEKLSEVFNRTDDSILGKVGSVLKGGNAESVSKAGGSLLTTLFGDNLVTDLLSGIGKVAGLGSGSAKSLLGFLVPIVFGAVKRLVTSKGLSLSWLIKLMLSQKDSIAKALPKLA